MKKAIAAILMSAVMVLALPAMAFASGSPVSDYTHTTASASAAGGSSTVDIYYEAGTQDSHITGTSSDTPSAVTSQMSSTEKNMGSYAVSLTGGTLNPPVRLTFNVGASNAGKTAYVYVTDENGTTKLTGATVDSNGNVSFSVTSTTMATNYTVTVDSSTGGTSTDGSSKSPSTGASPLTVVLVTCGALLCAGAATAVARRKMFE